MSSDRDRPLPGTVAPYHLIENRDGTFTIQDANNQPASRMEFTNWRTPWLMVLDWNASWSLHQHPVTKTLTRQMVAR